MSRSSACFGLWWLARRLAGDVSMNFSFGPAGTMRVGWMCGWLVQGPLASALS